MRFALVLICAIACCNIAFSQNLKEKGDKTQDNIYIYAYITVENKGFGKKLDVNVDLGDIQEQIKRGREYSEVLTNKKSYAAILNYMAENQFDLVESRDINLVAGGTGGTSGVIFIMRKAK